MLMQLFLHKTSGKNRKKFTTQAFHSIETILWLLAKLSDHFHEGVLRDVTTTVG